MSRARSNHGSSRVELRVKHGRIMGRTRSNYESIRVICFSFTSKLLNDQYIGSVKSLACACSKIRSYPGWGVRSDFRRKLRRSNEHYSRTKSNHGSNRVESWVEQGRIMSRTGSNHESNRVKSWVEQGRIMSRTRSNHESNRIESWVEQGRNMSRTGSNNKMNTVESWVEQGRTNHESNRVESWIEQGRIMSRTRSNHGSSRVELRVKHNRIMGRTRSNYESNRVKFGLGVQQNSKLPRLSC